MTCDANLKRIYETLNWDRRRTLLDDATKSFQKREISDEEYYELNQNLKDTCPPEDEFRFYAYQGLHCTYVILDLIQELDYHVIGELIYQQITIEEHLDIPEDITTAYRNALPENERAKQLTRDEAIQLHSANKVRLCSKLKPYGLSDEDRNSIMTGKLILVKHKLFELLAQHRLNNPKRVMRI